jgi:hypothetical protein
VFFLSLTWTSQNQRENNRTRIERMELINTDFLIKIFIRSYPFDQLNPRSIKCLFIGQEVYHLGTK